jgi:hypothetical protein
MASPKPKSEPPDEVDRAVKGARAAVGRLVKLLGGEDGAVVQKAMAAIGEVGPFAVGPLAYALPRAKSAEHRVVIMCVLKYFGARAEVPVVRALLSASRNDPDPRLRAVAVEAMSAVMMDKLKQRLNSTPAAAPTGIPAARG